MARRKRRHTPPAPIAPELRARFRKLMEQPFQEENLLTRKPGRTIGGFAVIKGNELWRWDTLEDVTF